jgi:transposase InsO family protein
MDLFARRVVGWAVGDRLHRDLAMAALRKALLMRRPSAGLIHHSDRGSQLEFKRSSQYRFQSFLWLRQKPQPAFASLMFSLVGC